MRVYFFTNKRHDYLSESLFHGLRTLLGSSCIDITRYDQLYKNSFLDEKSRLRGNGFSLYGLLEDYNELEKLRSRDFKKDINHKKDLVVLNDIMIQYGLFEWLIKKGHRKIAILDGADFPYFYPYQSLRLCISINPKVLFSNLTNALYFKREYINDSILFRKPFLPMILGFDKKNFLKKVKKISFSIPEEKIFIVTKENKSKTFNSHIVDSEIAFIESQNSSSYVFENENDYYKDLQKAKFGITTKRRGWDCLRHYELAANGAVLCFKNLNQKPLNCAPHGLIDGFNCISYSNYADLKSKIKNISDQEYSNLLKNNYDWIKKQTTITRAQEFLSHFNED